MERTDVRVARRRRACEAQEGQRGRRGEQVFEWRAGTSERAKRRKGNGGDGENRCSSGAPAQTSARRARRATEAMGRTDVRVARHKRACEAQEGQPRRRGEKMFESREGGSKQKRRGATRTRRVKRRRASRSAACAHPARPMGGSALNPRSAGARHAHGASAGVASSLQCRYYDQQPGKSAANTGQNARSVVVVAP